MAVSVDFSPFDIINSPVFICESGREGKILYKNHAAKHCIRLPLSGAELRKRLREGFEESWDAVCSGAQSAIVELNTDSVYFRALAFRYRVDDTMYIALVFPAALRQNLLSGFIDAAAMASPSLATAFCRCLDSIREAVISGELEAKTENKLVLARQSSVVASVSEVITQLYGDRASIYNRREFYVKAALEVLRDSVGNKLSKSGYRCTFDLTRLSPSLRMTDFGRVCASLFTVLTLVLSLSSDRRVAQRSYTATDDEGVRSLVFECRFNCDLSMLGDNIGKRILSADELAELYPKLMLDIVIADRLAAYRGWHCEFEVDDRELNSCFRVTMDVDDAGIVYGAPSADTPQSDHDVITALDAMSSALLLGIEP